VLLTHLSEVIHNNLAQLLSYKDMRALPERLEPEYKRLLDDMCPSQISQSGLLATLKLLLAEPVARPYPGSVLVKPDPDDDPAAPDDLRAPHVARFVDMHCKTPRQWDVARQREPQPVQRALANSALAHEPESGVEHLGGTQAHAFARVSALLRAAAVTQYDVRRDDPVCNLASRGQRLAQLAPAVGASPPAVASYAFERLAVGAGAARTGDPVRG